jgi:hypothetical protein
MAVTLGGTSIVPPAAEGGYRVEEVPRGRMIDLASGKVNIEVWENITRRHILSWKFITAAQFSTLKGVIEATGEKTFVPPYGLTSVKVVVAPGSWKYTPRKLGNGSTYYSCEVVLSETGNAVT